jgi:hypothetical protein
MKWITTGLVCALLTGVAVTSFGSSSSSSSAQRSLRCLHDLSEQPPQRERRMQAIDVAEAIYRAERRVVPRPRSRQDTYRPLDQLGTLPATPDGFRLQFLTDGMSYTVSLKDTLDGCQYAIFSDQDGYIYEGPPRRDVRVIPVDTQ